MSARHACRARADDACGFVDDGCGTFVACGDCRADDACVDNRCAVPSCDSSCLPSFVCGDDGGCEPVGDEIVIDLPLVTFEGHVDWPAQTPRSCRTVEAIGLDRDTRTTVEVCPDDDFAWRMVLLQGRYTIRSTNRTAYDFTTTIPVLDVDAIGGASRALDLEVPDVPQARVTLDCRDMVVRFIPLDGSAAITSACTRAVLSYGTWRVEVDAQPSTTLRPLHQVLDEAFVVDEPEIEYRVGGTIAETMPLTLTFTLDHEAPADDDDRCFDLHAESVGSRRWEAEARACADTGFSTTLDVPTGLVVGLRWSAADFGAAGEHVVSTQVTAPTTRTLDVAARFIDVSVEMTARGEPLAVGRCPQMAFVDLDTDARVFATGCSTFRLRPGRFRIVGNGGDNAVDIPPFSVVLAHEADLRVSRRIHVDFAPLPTSVLVRLRHNGVLLDGSGGTAIVALSPVVENDLDYGDVGHIAGDGRIGAWEGRYDIVVFRGTDASLPERSVFRGFDITSTTSNVPIELDLVDVVPHERVVQILVNGEPPSFPASWSLFMSNLDDGTFRDPLVPPPGQTTVTLPAGTWRFAIGHDELGLDERVIVVPRYIVE